MTRTSAECPTGPRPSSRCRRYAPNLPVVPTMSVVMSLEATRTYPASTKFVAERRDERRDLQPDDDSPLKAPIETQMTSDRTIPQPRPHAVALEEHDEPRRGEEDLARGQVDLGEVEQQDLAGADDGDRRGVLRHRDDVRVGVEGRVADREIDDKRDADDEDRRLRSPRKNTSEIRRSWPPPRLTAGRGPAPPPLFRRVVVAT